LDCAITEDNAKVLASTKDGLVAAQRRIFDDLRDENCKKRIIARKLNQFGSVKSHSGICNDEATLRKMSNKFTLAASIEAIKATEEANKVSLVDMLKKKQSLNNV